MRRGDLGPRLNRTVLTFARGVRLARQLSNELQQSGDGLTVHAYTDLPIDYDLNKLPGVRLSAFSLRHKSQPPLTT